MAWINLLIAGMFEVLWAVELKYSNGLTNIMHSIITIAGMIASFWFLSQAVKILPIGTSYAIWTGFGVLGTAILGIILLGEQVSPYRILFLFMILIGIIGLKLTYQQ